jgi:DNA repair ATPase RecN
MLLCLQVPTIDTARFSYLLEACLDVGRSVLLTGVTGVGKSVITVDALEKLRDKKVGVRTRSTLSITTYFLGLPL